MEVLEGLGPPKWSQDSPNGGHREPSKAPKTVKKRNLFYKELPKVKNSYARFTFTPFWLNFGSHFGSQNRSKIDPEIDDVFDAIFDAVWVGK